MSDKEYHVEDYSSGGGGVTLKIQMFQLAEAVSPTAQMLCLQTH